MDEEGSNSKHILMPSEIEHDGEDREANEDLSWKIGEKAMLRSCSKVNDDEEAAISTNLKEMEKQEDHAEKVEGEENVDTTKVTDIGDNASEKNPVETCDNAVLRRLLRGPRYFDSPDTSWGTCYNCGEEGHAAANCTSARRKKPCFVCGSFEHNAKHCKKGKACFICKNGGHRANDCPERSHGGSDSSKLCLKCGDPGHDMFSCRNSYSADDLKEIQCYICESSGHLCCVKYPDGGPREFSCYKCGLLGHTGLECTASRGEASGTVSLSSCYRCGEEGHFARKCTNLTRVNKRNHESSTPKKKISKKRKEPREFRSVPRDFGSAWKKKGKTEGGYTSGYKMKRRGGWVMDDPEDFPRSNKMKRRGGWIMDDPEDFPRSNNWRSPSTPRNKRAKISNYGTGGNASVSNSSRKSNRLDFDNSASYGSDKYPHRGKHESRFGNSGHKRWKRNYDW